MQTHYDTTVTENISQKLEQFKKIIIRHKKDYNIGVIRQTVYLTSIASIFIGTADSGSKAK